MRFKRAAIISYRLGQTDGVSVEAEKWCWALRHIGVRVHTVAGGGRADYRIDGLDAWDDRPPDEAALARALDDVDIVVAENICSLPLNPRASDTVARHLKGRPAVLHHHDLAWQRVGLGDTVVDDPHWVHVTVNELSRRQLRERGISATLVRNCFATPPPGNGLGTRKALGVGATSRLVLQPTRAIARKDIASGLAVARKLDATYWLTGAAEEGYEEELDRLWRGAGIPVVHRPAPLSMAGAYAAADAVVLPSIWEGFGNPAVEGSLHRRPVVVGPYPVAQELMAMGFRWFGLTEIDQLAAWFAHPDPGLIDQNERVARSQLALKDLPGRLEAVLASVASRA